VNCLYLIREFRIGFDDILIILQNQVQNTEGVFVKKNRSTNDLEQFLSSIRFYHREKLEGMGMDF